MVIEWSSNLDIELQVILSKQESHLFVNQSTHWKKDPSLPDDLSEYLTFSFFG